MTKQLTTLSPAEADAHHAGLDRHEENVLWLKETLDAERAAGWDERAATGQLRTPALDRLRAAATALLLAAALSAQIAVEEDVLDRGGVPRLPAAFSPWAEVA